MTSTINITQQVIQRRQAICLEEERALENICLPEWMQKPFDDYFSKQSQAQKNNVIPVNFGKTIMNIPKTLAAGSEAQANQLWYEQGMVSYRNEDGATLSVTFNKASDHNGIDVTVFVSNGDSAFLNAYQGQSDIRCSIYDKDILLASLVASVNYDGSFMYAEGQVLSEQAMHHGGDHLSIRFDEE